MRRDFRAALHRPMRPASERSAVIVHPDPDAATGPPQDASRSPRPDPDPDPDAAAADSSHEPDPDAATGPPPGPKPDAATGPSPGPTADAVAGRSPRANPSLLREAFGGTFLLFAAAAAVAGVAVYRLHGAPVFEATLREDFDLLVYLVPKLGAALLIAGFVTALLPPDLVGRWLGENSGVAGMAVATVAGAATPGGPMTSFPVVTALRDAGVGRAPLIAYVTAWTTLGLQRVLIWEIPLMGLEFALVRFVASLPLAILSGTLSRIIPINPDVREGT